MAANYQATSLLVDEEDEDAFLYGDDTSTIVNTTNDGSSTTLNTTAATTTTGDNFLADDDELAEAEAAAAAMETDSATTATTTHQPVGNDENEEEAEEAEEEEEEEDESSESDFEVVIDETTAEAPTEPAKRSEALVTLKHQGQKNATGTGGNAGGSNGTAGGTGDGTGDIEEDEVNGTKTTTTVKAGTVDLRAVAELNGKSIYDVDPDSLEDRPWRKPGADLTDYFNYGFDESTWRMYCARQKQIREELSIKKRMNALESKGDLHELPTELQATSLGQASTSTGMPNSTPTLLPHGMPPGMMGLPPGMGIPGMPNLPFPPPPHIMAAVAARGGWQNPAGMSDNPTSGTTNTTSNNPNNPNDKQQASFRPPVFMPDMSGGMPPPFPFFPGPDMQQQQQQQRGFNQGGFPNNPNTITRGSNHPDKSNITANVDGNNVANSGSGSGSGSGNSPPATSNQTTGRTRGGRRSSVSHRSVPSSGSRDGMEVTDKSTDERHNTRGSSSHDVVASTGVSTRASSRDSRDRPSSTSGGGGERHRRGGGGGSGSPSSTREHRDRERHGDRRSGDSHREDRSSNRSRSPTRRRTTDTSSSETTSRSHRKRSPSSSSTHRRRH